MTITQKEIEEQPQALQRLLDAEFGNIQNLASAIRARAPRFVMLGARGSSDNAARYGQYLFGALNRLPVALATPSLFTLYQTPPRLSDALVLTISQSGQSPDILSVIEEGRRQGALTITITNDPASPMAGLAEHCIPLHAGVEQGIAATKTYTASLFALAMLNVALTGEPEQQRALTKVTGFISRVLKGADEFLAAAEAYRDIDDCVVIGRGFNYATSFEIALKIKELTGVLAEPYSSADFQHGPVALVRDGFPVLVIVPEGRVAAELVGFLREIQPRRPRLIVISPLKEALDLADTPLPLPHAILEWLSPLVAVVPGQLFAIGLTQAKGLDPDHPAGLYKVTFTL